jgi:hypothetical protein
MSFQRVQEAEAARLAKRVSKLENKGKFGEALSLNTQAISLSRTMRQTYPDDPTHASVLWGRLVHQALILDGLGRGDEGRDVAKEALDLAARLLDGPGGDSPTRITQDRRPPLSKEMEQQKLLKVSGELREMFGL